MEGDDNFWRWMLFLWISEAGVAIIALGRATQSKEYARVRYTIYKAPVKEDADYASSLQKFEGTTPTSRNCYQLVSTRKGILSSGTMKPPRTIPCRKCRKIFREGLNQRHREHAVLPRKILKSGSPEVQLLSI